jgi:hypothetical protein
MEKLSPFLPALSDSRFVQIGAKSGQIAICFPNTFLKT